MTNSRPASCGVEPTASALEEPLLVDDEAPTVVSRAFLVHVAVASVSGLLSGYNFCVISSVLSPVEHSLQLCQPAAGTCAAKQLAVSATPIGAMVGGLLGGILSDRFGRRVGLLATDTCFMIGAASMSGAASGARAVLFFGGRFFVGAAAGAAVAISNTYIAEISPPTLRGTACAVNELGLCTGCLLAYIAAIGFGDEGWPWTCGLPAAAALAQFVAVGLLLFESPAWLLARRQQQRQQRQAPDYLAAATALGLARSLPQLVVDDDEAGAVAHSSGRGSSSGGEGTMPHEHRIALVLSCGLAAAHALSAANTILYYSRDILQSAGFDDHPVTANLLVGVLKFIGASVAMLVVDRFGRKRLLAAFALLMSSGYLVLALSSGPLLSLASLLVIIFSWSVSWAGLQWTVVAELLPQPVRGVGIGVATAVYWFISFVLSQTLESAFDALGESATLAAFGVATAAAAIFVWTCVPETKGVALR
jgi:sugar porter (SP) family MFS transporter